MKVLLPDITRLGNQLVAEWGGFSWGVLLGEWETGLPVKFWGSDQDLVV